LEQKRGSEEGKGRGEGVKIEEGDQHKKNTKSTLSVSTIAEVGVSSRQKSLRAISMFLDLQKML
jgi:hypothetical protein